jgi:hypothetical protein
MVVLMRPRRDVVEVVTTLVRLRLHDDWIGRHAWIVVVRIVVPLHGPQIWGPRRHARIRSAACQRSTIREVAS